MTTNKVAKECLSDGINQLSRSALREIASGTNVQLIAAIKYADDGKAIAQEPAYLALQKLVQACNAILAMQ